MKTWMKPMMTKDFALEAGLVGVMLTGVIFALGFAMSTREGATGYSYLDKANIASLSTKGGENS
ncbi:MAG: hypothetical protein VX730_03605 [Pseudomonadota bacterium]|nr:hypothetical protein [Pseudomonadota bacterium]